MGARAGADRELVRWDAQGDIGVPPFARLVCEVCRNDGKVRLEVVVQRRADEGGQLAVTSVKTVRIDRKAVRALDLVGKDQQNLVGAKIAVEVAGRTLTSFVKGGGSWGSACDPRHRFGLGPADQIDRLTVTWPKGSAQTWPGAAFTANRYWRLVEGDKTPQVWATRK